MKHLVLFLSFSFLLLACSFGQSEGEITSKKVFGGYTFSQGDKTLTINQLLSTMKENPEAYDLMKSAKSTTDAANVLGVIGGFMIGWPLGSAIGGGEPNWALAGIGAGVLAVGIPVSISANRKLLNAVDRYNQGLENTSMNYSPKLNLTFGNGFGLALNF
ncbi:MAG: hypothetical protein ABJ004_03115 [Cyclobacteriaceae bacterium]